MNLYDETIIKFKQCRKQEETCAKRCVSKTFLLGRHSTCACPGTKQFATGSKATEPEKRTLYMWLYRFLRKMLGKSSDADKKGPITYAPSLVMTWIEVLHVRCNYGSATRIDDMWKGNKHDILHLWQDQSPVLGLLIFAYAYWISKHGSVFAPVILGSNQPRHAQFKVYWWAIHVFRSSFFANHIENSENLITIISATRLKT